MKYTFEISICGCDTICKHCYVGGGPSSIMNFEIYQRIVEKLKPVISRLGDDIAITLGNEPFKHP